MAEWMVTVGDCRVVMAAMDAESVDAVVCDPPYELSFMGKGWDGTGIAYDVAMWGEVLRVLKPGGHLLAFGGTRTFHRMTVAIEDAGFEVRDCLSWLYGSGFPKSHNVGKNVDKHLKAARVPTGDIRKGGWRPGGNGGNLMNNAGGGLPDIVETAPATPEAARWEGWGTALKPAWEPIVMARKRLVGTVAGNVLAFGTGGLNIDGSRIPGWWKPVPPSEKGAKSGGIMGKPVPGKGGEAHAQGRWPANVLMDEGAAAALDEQSGVRPGGAFPAARGDSRVTSFASGRQPGDQPAHKMGDSGGASRFYYVAKASRRDRNEGLEGMEERGKVFNGQSGEPSGNASGSVEDKFSTSPSANHHPTVKPTALMRHLVRLVTPPGGLVLDPFTGSGSTGKAAVLEGFRFHGIEQDAEYAEIARARIAWAEAQVDAEQPTLM